MAQPSETAPVATPVAARNAVPAGPSADFSSLFDFLPIGAYRSSPEGKQLRANPALVRLNGFASEAEQLAGVQDIATAWYVDPQRRGQFKRMLERDGQVVAFESEIWRYKTRERIWVSENAQAVRDAAGDVLFYEGTVEDTTARKQAEELRVERDRAEAADLAKSQFLSRVSHELRTPLNAVLGFSQLLEIELRANPQQLAWVQNVLSSGRHLLALIDDILDLSSAQTGQLPLNIDGVPVRAVVDEAWAMLAAEAARASVSFHCDIAADVTLAVRADRKRLKQVLINLISNAIKYNRSGGWVRVSAQANTNAVQIAVADNGIGLAPAQCQRLFQPFERLGAQRSDVPGSGLGLALSQQLTERMGGCISVSSQLSQGSVFTVSLPAG